MKGIQKIYTTVTFTQLSVTFFALSISSLGMVIEHPLMTYFWYLALSGIATIPVTYLAMGFALAISRSIHRLSSCHGSKLGQDWLSRPKGLQTHIFQSGMQ